VLVYICPQTSIETSVEVLRYASCIINQNTSFKTNLSYRRRATKTCIWRDCGAAAYPAGFSHTHFICHQILRYGPITVLKERTFILSLFHKCHVHFYTQCSPENLGLMFLKIEDTYPFLFNIRPIPIYTVFCAVVHFLNSCQISSFWTFFPYSVTASWISTTSAKWSPFNFIFNLGNRKYSGRYKSGE